MTARIALCMALLEGRALTVMNCFKIIGFSNIAREIPRLIEKPFGVTVSRTSRVSKNRYNMPVNFTEYRLNTSDHNIEGIKKLKEFVQKYLPQENQSQYTQSTLF